MSAPPSIPINLQDARLLSRLFVILLIGGVIFDFSSIVLHYHESAFWRASLIFRGTVGILISLIVLIWFFRWPNYARWLVISSVISVALLWAGFAIAPTSDLQDYFESTLQIYKMVYPVLLFVGLRQILQINAALSARLFRAVDIALTAYLCFIFIGLLSGNEMFRTYWAGLRPGYKGIIMSQNEATGLVLIAIFWFCLRYFSGRRHVIFLVSGIAAALILGTKGALLASLPLVVGMFSARYGVIRMIPIMVWILGSILVIVIFVFYSSETIQMGVAMFFQYMASHSSGDSIREMISLLMSGRDLRLEAFYPTFEDDLSLYFLIGGMPITYGSMEIDPIDALLRGGCLFVVLLLISYWKIFRFSGGTGGKAYKVIFFAIWMGIAFTGGHMWMASTTAPMLIIALVYAGRMNSIRDWTRDAAGRQKLILAHD